MVTIGSNPVTTKQRQLKLRDATFPIFDSVQEAISHPEHGLGEAKVLELLNAQIKTNAMNARRAEAKGPTKTVLAKEAQVQLIQEIAGGAHQDVIGNPDAWTALLAKRMAEIEARMKEAAGVAGEVDDEDDDEEAA